MKKVVLYIRKTNIIGGIETFIYNFCANLHNDYDITVVALVMADVQAERLRPFATVITGELTQTIECDTLLMLRVLDPIPDKIKYKKVIRRIHTRKACGVKDVPRDGDVTVCVSDSVKDDFDLTDSVVIHNLVHNTAQKTLLLISATRIPAPDKGDNMKRMKILAEKLEDAKIPYLWLNFSDGEVKDMPKNFYNMGCRMDILNYMQKADYIVQLSTYEACSNTVIEALMLNKPLICTPVPCFFEVGVRNGVNAHVVPFDMDFDVNILLDIPKYSFNYDNDKRVKAWKKIL